MQVFRSTVHGCTTVDQCEVRTGGTTIDEVIIWQGPIGDKSCAVRGGPWV